MWQEQFEVPEKVTVLVRIQEFDLDRVLLAIEFEGDKIRLAVLYNVRQVIKVHLFSILCYYSEHVLLTYNRNSIIVRFEPLNLLGDNHTTDTINFKSTPVSKAHGESILDHPCTPRNAWMPLHVLREVQLF